MGLNDSGNALFDRSITLTANYVAVAAGFLFWGTILAAANNVGAAYMKGDDGSDCIIPDGVAVKLDGVDLGQLQLKGTAGDLVAIIGECSTRF
jgi:hypothetical protein